MTKKRESHKELMDQDGVLTQEQKQRLMSLCENLDKLPDTRDHYAMPQDDSLTQIQKEEIATELDDLWYLINNIAMNIDISLYSEHFEFTPHSIVCPKKLKDILHGGYCTAPDELIDYEIKNYEVESWHREAILDKIKTILRLVTSNDYYEIALDKDTNNRGQSVKLLEQIIADTKREGVECTPRAWKSFKKNFSKIGCDGMLERFKYDPKKQKITTTIPVGKLFIKNK